jgi:hypothetical protein
MKKHLTYPSLLLMSLLLYSCGPKFNGHSEKEYEASRKIVEQKLDKSERQTLEKALRVIVAESMRLKWDEPAKYKGQSFNAIALKLIDGRTYSSLTSEAEDILQTQNKRKVTQLTAEIDSLEKKQSADAAVLKQASSLFRIDSASINKVDWFGTQTPRLDLDYSYTGKQPLKGAVTVSVQLFRTGTPEPLISETWQQGTDTTKLNPGETLSGNLMLSNLINKEPQKWSTLKYPLKTPDLKTQGLHVQLLPVEFTLNGKQITVANLNASALSQQIKDDKAELKEVENSKGTLDEWELTDGK